MIIKDNNYESLLQYIVREREREKRVKYGKQLQQIPITT